VRFVWVRRNQNTKADAAASGRGSEQEASFRDSWGNQTELGKRVGLSAVAVGKKLKELGLRDAHGAATDIALRDGYCKATPLKDGTPFFMWNIRKVMQLLNPSG
jgi:hypothetical protein